MKQYVQTDLEADRQVANTLAELILGGALGSIENPGSDVTGRFARVRARLRERQQVYKSVRK
ncbi:MAG: hypothetical protein ABSF03_18730 [Streptosporangiaceae bacterium]|jgi:hypothetical protein